MVSKNYSLSDYWIGVLRYREQHEHQRYGQSAFNYLAQIRPDLSERIRGTAADPFYCDHKHPTLEKFSDFLRENW